MTKVILIIRNPTIPHAAPKMTLEDGMRLSVSVDMENDRNPFITFTLPLWEFLDEGIALSEFDRESKIK